MDRFKVRVGWRAGVEVSRVTSNVTATAATINATVVMIQGNRCRTFAKLGHLSGLGA
jgi:hypothetical protein